MQQFNIIMITSKMGNSNTNTCPFEDKQFMVSLKNFQKEAEKYDFLKDDIHKVIDEEIYKKLVTMVQPLFSSIFGFFKKEMNENEINICTYDELIETIKDVKKPIQKKVETMNEIFSMKKLIFGILNGIELFNQSKFSVYDLNVDLDTINADIELKDFYDNVNLLFKNISIFIKKTTDGEKELASTMKETNKTLRDSLDSFKLMLEISDIKNDLNNLIQETENYQPKNSDDLTIFINNGKIKTLNNKYSKKFKEYLDLLPENQRNIIQQLHEGKITQDEFKQYSDSLITKKEEYKIDENHQLIIDNFRKTEQTSDDIKNVYNQLTVMNC
jgi:hypothetical protein